MVCPLTQELDGFHPFSLQTITNAEDNPTYDEAMHGPYADAFRDAMQIEFDTLNDQMGAWDIVEREPQMNVLSSTWAFKIKRYPDGRIKKLKARFCVRGYEQIEGVDYFDTYAPVITWTTVRLLLILTVVLGLKSKQVDYTAAFVHAPVEEDIYVEMPRGFETPNHVLKLKKSLYGLKQSPRNFFHHLRQGLLLQGFRPSEFDECLFIHKHLLCVTYVDDCLFFAFHEDDITSMIKSLRRAKHTFEIEDDIAGYLGVLLDHNEQDDTITLTQTGLIERIIQACNMEDCTPKSTPAETKPLPQNKDGPPAPQTFNYASVIGMLTYLAGHTRPDIAYAVHQCARYTFNPKVTHENAVKRIVRYLKHTKDKGLIISKPDDLHIKCFVDADFAGLWTTEDRSDPHSVKSRTGFVICVGDIPVIWQSKLQTEIALSTFEAEYVALSTAMRDVLPFLNLYKEIITSLHIDAIGEISINTNTDVYEDNASCEKLANMEMSRYTPQSKHFGIKYHWFRKKLKPNHIQVKRVETKENIADIFTKGLRGSAFEYLRFKLLGWGYIRTTF